MRALQAVAGLRADERQLRKRREGEKRASVSRVAEGASRVNVCVVRTFRLNRRLLVVDALDLLDHARVDTAAEPLVRRDGEERLRLRRVVLLWLEVGREELVDGGSEGARAAFIFVSAPRSFDAATIFIALGSWRSRSPTAGAARETLATACHCERERGEKWG